MKVHFITSRPTLLNDIDAVRQITDIIKESKHSITLDWVEKALQRNDAVSDSVDWSRIYKENLEAIAQSDIIIAEATHENFAVGYQVAMAVQQKKPVLMLRKKEADKNAFVTGVEDGWVQHREYNETELKQIVNKFIKENDIDTKDMRFNFFIDRHIYNYLRWAALRTGKTKAEILRNLVQKELDKDKEED